MRKDTYRVPGNDQEVLIEPPLDELPGVVESNRQLLLNFDLSIHGQPFQDLRAQTRQAALRSDIGGEQLELDSEAPIIMTGHQAEFFHPGIWFKNFLTAHLASDTGGVGMNMVVDSDTCGLTGIRFPQMVDGSIQEREIQFLFNGQELATADCLLEEHTDFEPLREVAIAADLDAHLKNTLEKFLNRLDMQSPNLAIASTRLRRSYEQDYGINNIEFLLGTVESTDAFLHFFIHIVEALPAFQKIYNEALHQYRRIHAIRSKANPLPDLDPDETPFWLWRKGEPRFPLRVLSDERSTHLLLGETPIHRIDFSLDADEQVWGLRDALGDTFCLRSRALTTTMFFRLFCADLFIHGVGGGKYDNVTDTIIENFFSIKPPVYAVSSATVHLPTEAVVSGSDDIDKLRYQARDVNYNPDRYAAPGVRTSAEFEVKLAEKKQILESMPDRSKTERYKGFLRLKQLNHEMLAGTPSLEQNMESKLAAALAVQKQKSILQGRNYPFFLFPQKKIQSLVTNAGLL